MIWVGSDIISGAGQARSKAFFDIQGGRASIHNPRFQAIESGSGNALRIANDERHDIEINALSGWGVVLPTTIANGSYSFDAWFSAVPTVDFATRGNSLFSYTTQTTSYRLQGGQCTFVLNLRFTSNAYTTAAGAFLIRPNIPVRPVLQTGATLTNVANIQFNSAQQYGAEFQTDGTILIRIFTSNAPLENFSSANVPPSRANIGLTLTGSFVV